jgi:hypothetical protein
LNKKKLEKALNSLQDARDSNEEERKIVFEKTAIELIKEVMDSEPARAKEFTLLIKNIEFRRNVTELSHKHEAKAAAPIWGVPMLLRMYDLDLAFSQKEMERMLVFLAMHDNKNISPTKIEEKIVNDADLWDSITLYSIKKTINYNVLHGAKTFFDPTTKIEDRLKWLMEKTDDILTVLLGQFFKWSFHLNLDETKHLFRNSLTGETLSDIEDEIVKIADLWQGAGKEVREVIDEYKSKVEEYNKKDKAKGPAEYKEKRKEVLTKYRKFLKENGGYNAVRDLDATDWVLKLLPKKRSKEKH